MVIFNCSIFLAVLVFFYQNEVEGQNTFKLLLVTSKRVSEEIYNTLANTLPFNFKLRLRFNAFKRFSHQHLNVIKQKKKKQQMHIIFILGVCISLPNCICISFGLVICMRRRWPWIFVHFFWFFLVFSFFFFVNDGVFCVSFLFGSQSKRNWNKRIVNEKII